ncbi:MAG: phosphotransferase [Myxococcota bacterium]
MTSAEGDNAHDLPLIDHPDRITPEWLSGVLANNEINASVTGFRSSPVGTGQMADNYRLELEYQDKPEGAPDSFVVKVCSTDPTSRASGAAGGYVTEVNFYRDLASRLAVRTPHCYHADISAANDVFVLVMEDLAPAEQGDQIRGCGPDEARLALQNLAGLHASSWCDAKLDGYSWLSRVTPEVAALFTNILMPATEGFIERYKARLSDEDASVLRHFANNAERWLTGRGDRFALVHGDYRLDNLLFGTQAGGAPVAAVDWQTVTLGHAGRDTAYFLGNSLVIEDRIKYEQDLIRG